MTFNHFKQHFLKEKKNESEEDFNERCTAVWTKLCEKADKYDVIQVEDEEGDDDNDDYDCEAEIEEMVDEVVETVDAENEC